MNLRSRSPLRACSAHAAGRRRGPRVTSPTESRSGCARRTAATCSCGAREAGSSRSASPPRGRPRERWARAGPTRCERTCVNSNAHCIPGAGPVPIPGRAYERRPNGDSPRESHHSESSTSCVAVTPEPWPSCRPSGPCAGGSPRPAGSPRRSRSPICAPVAAIGRSDLRADSDPSRRASTPGPSSHGARCGSTGEIAAESRLRTGSVSCRRAVRRCSPVRPPQRRPLARARFWDPGRTVGNRSLRR